MRTSGTRHRRCSYVVVLPPAPLQAGDLEDFARYCSDLGVAGCNVVVVDSSTGPCFAERRRVLRWVASHESARRSDYDAEGRVDLVRAAAERSMTDGVIVASADVRYTPEQIATVSELLQLHDVVAPEDCVMSETWWGTLEAARLLLRRGLSEESGRGETFAFQRRLLDTLRPAGTEIDRRDPVERLAARGAEICVPELFVTRRAARVERWAETRLEAAARAVWTPESLFFLALVPLVMLFGAAGSLPLVGGFAFVMALGSIALAIRGRAGRGSIFPPQACLLAPLWVASQSLLAWWAVFHSMRAHTATPAPVTAERTRAERAASGE